ncbi:syntaxin 1A [Sarotherodon galilaeus]
MDSAGQDPMGQALATQEAALARHEQMLMQLRNDITALTQAVAQLIPLEGNTLPGNVQPGNPQPANPAPQAAPPAAVTVSPPQAALSPDGPLPTPEPFSVTFLTHY